MAFDRDQFKEQAEQKLKDRQLSATLHLIHAAPPMEKLTNSQEWNSYLQMVQGSIEQDEKSYQDYLNTLASPICVNAEKIMFIRGQLHLLRGRIDMAKVLLDLPKQIIKAAASHSQPKESNSI